MGLSETLRITATEVHGGVLYREVNLSGPPFIECFLDGGPYRRGILSALILPSRGRRKRWQYLENLLRCLSEDRQLLSILL